MQDKINEVKSILEEYAKNKQLICYEDLYIRVGLRKEDWNDRNKGAEILAAINDETEINGLMLSSLVVLKGEHYPANGFFEYAEKQNLSDDEKIGFWAKEVNKCFNFYK